MEHEKLDEMRQRGFALTSEIEPDHRVIDANEAGYRRGFTHGLAALAEVLRADEDSRYHDALAVAVEMRSDRQPHPLFTREFARRMRGASEWSGEGPDETLTAGAVRKRLAELEGPCQWKDVRVCLLTDKVAKFWCPACLAAFERLAAYIPEAQQHDEEGG